MQSENDQDRLIHQVLAELGSGADPKAVADRVRRLDNGLPAEDEFIAICSWLGKARLIHKLDQDQAPPASRDAYQVPDILAHFEGAGPVLIEVKSKKQQTLSFKPEYLERLQSYAELLKMPLLIAWKYHRLWVLFDVRRLVKARKNFNISIGEAMKDSLLGVLAGDVAYKMFPGAGIRIRFRKEELVVTEEQEGAVTEEWRSRFDELAYTIADGREADDLDSDVKALFLTWDLNEEEVQEDSHIELQFIAREDDGMKFGHMALTNLLNWTLPQGEKINWRHASRRRTIVSSIDNFERALNRAYEQKVVRYIFHLKPQSWPDFLPAKSRSADD